MATNQIAAFTYPLIFFFSTGDIQGQAYAYGNIGNALSALGKFSEALEYAKKDLEMEKQTGEQRPIRSQHLLIR